MVCYLNYILLAVLCYDICIIRPSDTALTQITQPHILYPTPPHPFSHHFHTTTEHGDISRQIDKFKAANKYIKEDTIWSYLIQICNGLQIMHGRQVLHRDIKPKNVFLTGKNHVRLGDLGCAKLMKAGMARTQIGEFYMITGW